MRTGRRPPRPCCAWGLHPPSPTREEDGAEDGEAPDEDDGDATRRSRHAHLLDMPLVSLTRRRVEALEAARKRAQDRVRDLEGRSEYDMWRADLAALRTHLARDRAYARPGDQGSPTVESVHQ